MATVFDIDAPLRILYFERSADDAARVLAALERAGLSAHTEVTGAADEFREILSRGDAEVVLADVGSGDPMVWEAMAGCPNGGGETPLLVVTRYPGCEEEVTRWLVAGAADVVFKDRLARLPLALERVVSERRLSGAQHRAESALRSANQVLTALIRCAPLPITVIDENGTVNVWNPAAEEVLGWGREEVLGHTLGHVTGSSNGLGRLLEQALHRGGVIGAETSQTRKDGGMVDLRVFCAPLTDEDGNSQGVIAMLTDITERNLIIEAFRESKERFQSAFLFAPIGMAISSLDGRILRVNPALCRMLGYDESELLRQRLEDLVCPPDRSRLAENGAGKTVQCELRLRHQSGKPVPAQWNTSVVRDAGGRPQYRIGQVVDLTESKQAAEKIRRYALDLERSNQDLQHFAYVASHDLQEPLRMVRGFVELLARRYEGKLGADADEYIHYAVDGAKRMQNLIRGLLAYSRVGTQGKSFAPVDTGETVAQALLNLRQAIEESRAVVTHAPLPVVPADDVQLAQLFQNVIGNAVKFRGSEAPRVHIAVDEQDGEWRFAVRDNGIGFDPGHANRIFQMFQRLHSPAKYAGTGIGLALCKRIVERHGGRIWVESAPEKGSTFYFTLSKEVSPAA